MKKTVILPAAVMEDETYKNLSDGARVLFGLLTEKKEEAEKNAWIDHRGFRYVIFPKKQMQEELCCSRYWIDLFTKELEAIGLIKLSYLYKPIIERRFYVRTFDGDAPKIMLAYEPGGPAEKKGKEPETSVKASLESAPISDKGSDPEDPAASSIPPLPSGCPMRDSDVKDLALDLLSIMGGVVEELFRDPHEKKPA